MSAAIWWTHLSVSDGSPARLITTSGKYGLFENEDDDRWWDHLDEWAKDESVDTEDYS